MRTVERLMAVLVVVTTLALVWSSNSAATPAGVATPITPFDPSHAMVLHSRFVSTVKLDGGVVTIRPAPSGLRPKKSERGIEGQVWATSQIMSYRPQAFGFGLVTITKRAAGVPTVENLPAWVGLASDAQIAFSCPSFASTPTGPDPPLPTPGDAAVVVGSGNGSPAVVYRARSRPCASVEPASLSNALEMVSVPWTALGPVLSEAVNVQATVPACGSVFGVSSGGSAAAMTITVQAVVPESPVARSCIPHRSVSETVTLGPGRSPGAPPPLVGPGTQILHGATGLVRVVGPAT